MFLAGRRDERQRERAEGGNWHVLRNSAATTSMVRSAAAAAAAGVPFIRLARTETRANAGTMQVGPSFMYAIYIHSSVITSSLVFFFVAPLL